MIAILNPTINHTMVDGSFFPDEVESLGIASVPTVMAGDEVIHVGRGDMAAHLMEEDVLRVMAGSSRSLALLIRALMRVLASDDR